MKKFPRTWRSFYPVQLLLFTFSYFYLGKLGLSLAIINSSTSALWPPTGMALVALLVWGNRLWPGIFIGSFLVEYSVAEMLGVSLCTATGDVLEALVGAWLVRRFAGGLKVFEQTRTTLKYFCLAPLVSTTISATVGVTSLCWWQQASWADYGPTRIKVYNDRGRSLIVN